MEWSEPGDDFSSLSPPNAKWGEERENQEDPTGERRKRSNQTWGKKDNTSAPIPDFASGEKRTKGPLVGSRDPL